MPRVARCVAAIKRTKAREQLFPNTSETHLVLFQQRSVTMELSPPFSLAETHSQLILRDWMRS